MSWQLSNKLYITDITGEFFFHDTNPSYSGSKTARSKTSGQWRYCETIVILHIRANNSFLKRQEYYILQFTWLALYYNKKNTVWQS